MAEKPAEKPADKTPAPRAARETEAEAEKQPINTVQMQEAEEARAAEVAAQQVAERAAQKD